MRTPRTIAVVAHQRKTLGGGLDELRRRITDEAVDELLWY
jgi:diacylglycerol kinase (ATP)